MNANRKTIRATVCGILALASSCEDQAASPFPEPESAKRAETTDRITLSEEAFEALELRFAKAERREVSPTLRLTAELSTPPDRHAEVGSRVAGRVVEVRVNTGDRVRRGDALVVLDSPDAGKARAEYLAATARREVARKARDREAGLFQAKATSRRELEEAQGALASAEAEVAAARALLAAYGLAADRRANDAGRVVLSSPIDGIVTARAAHVGRFVQPTDTLVEVSDLDELWLLGDAFEQDLRLVQTGLPVEVEVRAWPGEVFRGKVDHVGDVLDKKTRTAKVRVVLANPDRRLKPGMFATARIRDAHAHEARPMLVVPWAAIQRIDDHPAVFVRADEREFVLRKVHTGERAGDDVEVLNGLAPGDVVVTDGSFLLKGELLKGTLGEAE